MKREQGVSLLSQQMTNFLTVFKAPANLQPANRQIKSALGINPA
jgi:hypothetical protein